MVLMPRSLDYMNSDILNMIIEQFPLALWETIYATFLATFFATLIGLPLGVILVTGRRDGIHPLPSWIIKLLDVLINILRSVPFLIVVIVVFPLTRLIVGTTVGTVASIVPLVVAAFPFIARLVEGSLREVDPNLIEMAKSMGATPFQIVTKVLLREAVPSLISNITIALTTILGYTAMSGIVGGGGLGKIAINYGYYRYNYGIMICAVIVLVILVQLIQKIGDRLSIKLDKRLKV